MSWVFTLVLATYLQKVIIRTELMYL